MISFSFSSPILLTKQQPIITIYILKSELHICIQFEITSYQAQLNITTYNQNTYLNLCLSFELI